MKRFRLIGLGMRMALAGGRASIVRLSLTAIGIGLGVTMLLGALSVSPALRAHDRREQQQYGSYTERTQNVTRRWWTGTTFEGREVTVEALEGVGAAPPVPVGIPRLPGQGEVYVSPALEELLRGPDGSLLAPRVPGRIVGIVDSDGLAYPGQLLAYAPAAGVVPHGVRDEGETVGTFAAEVGLAGPPGRAGTVVVLVLVVIGMSVPVGVFIVTVTRLSSSSREARLAAVRLAGATESQLRLLAGVETAVAAVLGTGLGILGFIVSRTAVARLPLLPGAFFASDIAPPPAAATALVVAMPLFALAVTNATLKRVVVTPLGIVRRARPARRRSIWPLLLAAGAASLALATWKHEAVLRQPSPLPGFLIGVPLLLLLVGLAGTTTWLGGWGGSLLARLRPSPALLLGGRRIETDPASSGRVVSGITTLIAITIVVQSIFLSQSSAGSFASTWRSRLLRLATSDVIVDGKVSPPREQTILDVPGVTGVEPFRVNPFFGSTCGGICGAIVHTDGAPDTVEHMRNALAFQQGIYDVSTRWDLLGESASTDMRYVRLLELALVVLLLVSAASLLVSIVDGMMERRRPLATLSAIGVGNRVLRGSVLVQVVVPLVIGLTIAIASGCLTASAVFRIAGAALVLPVGQIGVTIAAVAAVVLLVVGLSLPWLRVTRRPELLRND